MASALPLLRGSCGALFAGFARSILGQPAHLLRRGGGSRSETSGGRRADLRKAVSRPPGGRRALTVTEVFASRWGEKGGAAPTSSNGRKTHTAFSGRPFGPWGLIEAGRGEPLTPSSLSLFVYRCRIF